MTNQEAIAEINARILEHTIELYREVLPELLEKYRIPLGERDRMLQSFVNDAEKHFAGNPVRPRDPNRALALIPQMLPGVRTRAREYLEAALRSVEFPGTQPQPPSRN